MQTSRVARRHRPRFVAERYLERVSANISRRRFESIEMPSKPSDKPAGFVKSDLMTTMMMLSSPQDYEVAGDACYQNPGVDTQISAAVSPHVIIIKGRGVSKN